jgi:tetratricopeptide (TPR) repeat protein
MMLLQKHRVPAAIVFGVLVLIGLYLAFDKPWDKNTGTATTTPLGNNPGFEVEGDATITEISPEAAIPAPSLDRPITFENSQLPPEVQATVRAQIAEAIAAIKKEPLNLSWWLQLALKRKQAGDYEGARQAWVYVSTLAPRDETSLNNLGDLFMNFIKDYPQAEMYYKKLIAVNPKNIGAYNNLFLLYKYLYKTDTSAAADTKAQALKAVPSEEAYIATWH